MTRLESIKSNAFLLGLNMNKATKEQKIQWLCQIIDNETDKPEDEIDFALIGECSAYLRELSDKAAEATKEQKQRILQQIKARHNQTATKSAKILRPNWRKMGKIVAIAATVAAILLSTLTVLAKVNGYSSAWEYVKENIQKIIGMDAGDRMDDGGITLIKNDEAVAYQSIEELLEKENLDILYPSELPNSIRITQVSQQLISEDYTMYSIHFNALEQSIAISSKRNFSEEYLEQYRELVYPFFTVYIVKEENEMYQAVFFDGKYEYLICCNNYEVLIDILNSMKGVSK